MWFSKPLRHAIFAAFALGAGLSLSACSSFAPVYGGALASQPLLNLAYAKPNSRLEQVVYQELALRLGKSTAPTAPLATVSVSTATANMALTKTVDPSKPLEVTATATLTIAQRDGSSTDVVTIVRRATANYTRNSQVLADKAAAQDAAERAAKAAAESLRLAVLAELNRG